MDKARKRKQDSFIRICKDSGFNMDYIEAAKLAASVVGCHPFDISAAFSYDLGIMRTIATGDHKCTTLTPKTY